MEEASNSRWLSAPDEASFDQELYTLGNEGSVHVHFNILLSLTFFGLKLNFLMPSSSVVFFCFALSNLLGSSTTSGVGWRVGSSLPTS